MTLPDLSGLTPAQRRAVTAVLTHARLDEAAAACGVTPQTLRRWRASEPFTAAVRATAREADREAVNALLAAQGEAVETLRRAMVDTSAPALRVRAAMAVLDAGQRAQGNDLDDRIEDLERRIDGWHSPTHTGHE